MSRRPVLPWLSIAALALLFYAADRAQGRAFRRSVVALDAGEVAAAAAAHGGSASDFWERAEAMGVGAMSVRRQTLGALSRRGDVLLFSGPELEKWRTLGLIAPAAALKPNAVWVRDRALMRRVAEALSAQGVVLGTTSFAAHGIIELSREPEAQMDVGYEPEDLALAARLGLAPVELEPFGCRARVAASTVSWPAAVFEPAVGVPTLLRAARGYPGRLLLLRVDPGTGTEESLAALRARLRPLRELGVVGREFPAVAEDVRFGPGRRWLAWLLAVLGPIAAVRLGVRSFKRTRLLVLERRPVASPVAELVAGVGATAAAAAAIGAALGLLAAEGGAVRLPEDPAFSPVAWPLAIGLLALFPPSLRVIERWLRAVPSHRELLKFALIGLGCVLIFRPRLLLGGTFAWDWLRQAQDVSARFWWWPWRWREALVGAPALLYGLYWVGRRGESGTRDPRPWLWLGLLLPIGTIEALGRPGARVFCALADTVLVLAVGGAAAGALLVLRAVRQGSGPKA